MRKLVFILLTFLLFNCKAQNNEKFNLGFEKQDNPNSLSDGWFQMGDYQFCIDSTQIHSGRKSGRIVSIDKGSGGAIMYKIPAKYNGKTIELKGYMKTENVTNGFAGFMMRIDGSGQPLAYENMEKQNISGTKGIIIDIRNYPSTFVPFSLVSYFVNSTTPFIKYGIKSGRDELL